jgi:hypothetical protein
MTKKSIILKIFFLFILFFSISWFAEMPISLADNDDWGEDEYYERGEDNDDDEDKYYDEEEAAPDNFMVTPSIVSPQDALQEIEVKQEIKQFSYQDFIDTDKDGIADVRDQYPQEDDFAYLLVDNNNNGVADDLEKLLK